MPVACRRDSDREPLARGVGSGNEGYVQVGGQLRLVPVDAPAGREPPAFPEPGSAARPGAPSGSMSPKAVGRVNLGAYLAGLIAGSVCFCCGTALLAKVQDGGPRLTCPRCAAEVERA